MNKRQQQLLIKYNKKIEVGFLSILIGAAILSYFVFDNTNIYNSLNKNISSVQTGTPVYNYDNFWNKFNTFSVIMISMKKDSDLLSQRRLNRFQDKFMHEFGLTVEDKNVDRNGIPVDPDILFCYIDKYQSTDVKEIPNIIKYCAK